MSLLLLLPLHLLYHYIIFFVYNTYIFNFHIIWYFQYFLQINYWIESYIISFMSSLIRCIIKVDNNMPQPNTIEMTFIEAWPVLSLRKFVNKAMFTYLQNILVIEQHVSLLVWTYIWPVSHADVRVWDCLSFKTIDLDKHDGILA